MQAQKQQLMRFMQSVWNEGEFSQIDEMVDATYVVGKDPHDPWGGQVIDIETFKERVMYSRNAFGNLYFEVQETIAEKNKIAIRWKMSGIHSGDLPMLKASNKKFCIDGMTFYYFNGNKVCGHSQCFDQLSFLAQIEALAMS